MVDFKEKWRIEREQRKEKKRKKLKREKEGKGRREGKKIMGRSLPRTLGGPRHDSPT